MTGHEFMKRVRNTRRRIRLIEEQIERDTILAAGVGAIRYDKDRVQTSPVQDRMTEIVVRIIEATDELKDEITRLQVFEKETRFYLLKLPEKYERALSYHYLDNYTWEQTANEIGYDYKYIYELKDKALNELTKVLNESEQN